MQTCFCNQSDKENPEMIFQQAEDAATLKKIGINVALLTGVMLALIVISVVVG